MLADEASWREESRRRRLLKRAKFPVPKPFDRYDRNRIKVPAEIGREGIESRSFIGEGQNLILYGGVGNGKTRMAIACGTAACEMGMSAMFTAIADLVVRMTKAEGALEKASKEVERADLVVLDELGHLPVGREGAKPLYQVVNKCYERRSLMVTTNLEFSRWGRILTDDQMAAATIGRIVHYGHLVVLEGPTKRMEASPMARRGWRATRSQIACRCQT